VVAGNNLTIVDTGNNGQANNSGGLSVIGYTEIPVDDELIATNGLI